jgi:hypothetical protein
LTLGADRFGDLLLAVNDAIANAAEFGYCDAAHVRYRVAQRIP